MFAMIVGEKVVPVLQEDYLNSVPMVSSAIMFGRGRSQPGVIIELTPAHAIDPKDESALVAVRNKLWYVLVSHIRHAGYYFNGNVRPHVEEANKRAPPYSRLFKEMILIVDPAKPFARAAKGTAIRKVVLKAYDAEINAL